MLGDGPLRLCTMSNLMPCSCTVTFTLLPTAQTQVDKKISTAIGAEGKQEPTRGGPQEWNQDLDNQVRCGVCDPFFLPVIVIVIRSWYALHACWHDKWT